MSAADPALLDRIERYYDQVPRATTRVHSVGPFTLFVGLTGHPWYARPTLGRTEFTPADVAAVFAAQDALSVPRAIEWVDEVTPALTHAVDVEFTRHPLLVHDGSPNASDDPRVRMVEPDDPALADVIGAIDAGFRQTDTVEPGEVESRLARMREGLLLVAGAFAPDGHAVGGGLSSPRSGVSEIAGVAVVPNQRRAGLAGAITRCLVEASVRAGCDTIFLSAMDDAASRVYQRVGFSRVATACICEPG